MKKGKINTVSLTMIASVASLAANSAGAQEQCNKKKPNVIYVLLDDAGYGDFSFQGQKKFKTPNIDKMAEEGVQFSRHYSGSTVCAPSRCVLLTGLHTGHAQVRGNKSMKSGGQLPLTNDTITVAKKAKEAGYVTGMFGKWGLGSYNNSGSPNKQGFDKFYGYTCQAKAHNYYPEYLWDNGKKIMLNKKVYTHDLIVDEAFKFIKENKDKPFFVYFPITIPHAALQVPEKYVKPFRAQFPETENKMGYYDGTKIRNPRACFAGMMYKLDLDMGRMVQLLKDLKIDENTIIMFASDNGPHKEGGHDPKYFNSNGGLRGVKRDLYEGGIRTAFFVRYPNKVKGGRKSALKSSFQDFMPTFCDFAGVKAPENCDGISFKNEILGDSVNQKKHDNMYWEFIHNSVGSLQAVIFADDWKLVKISNKKTKKDKIELYNLNNDMKETKNLAKQYPEKVAEGLEIMKQSHTGNKYFKLVSERK
ncbi:arylsulfatase [Lentisphaerota bacterium WC36G]|nr:arylsulfatase [Lentisphaerae bacterium WC36]